MTTTDLIRDINDTIDRLNTIKNLTVEDNSSWNAALHPAYLWVDKAVIHLATAVHVLETR